MVLAVAQAQTFVVAGRIVGGAVLSVLPLPFLPFEPEQSVSHYLSHVVLGIAQVPLIVVPLKERRQRSAQGSESQAR